MEGSGMNKKLIALLSLVWVTAACGHTATHKVGLISLGDLQGKTISGGASGAGGAGVVVEGTDCGYTYSLSNAARDALKGSTNDTLVDVEVTNTTGLLVPSNCIRVKARAIDSKALTTRRGGGQ
jgi:hypothetical protein